MKIGILHLTDIHFDEKENWIKDKISKIVNASHIDLKNIQKAYLVISGDVANKGKSEEYDIAEIFITKLIESLKRFCPNVDFKIIIIPGNHDCNFDHDSQSRKNNLIGMDYNKLGDDFSVVDTCIEVQQDFWKFYSKFNPTPLNKLFYQIKDEVSGKTIKFNCYNTAWMSELNEKVGTLFFPVNKISSELLKKDEGITISIFHHPLNWFNPSTEINNRREFKKHLEENSSILIYGHEHEIERVRTQNISDKFEKVHISGSALQNEIDISGFQIITIDLESKTVSMTEYNWSKSKEFYKSDSPENFTINHINSWHKDFQNNKDFLKNLNKLTLPLKIENKGSINISDIYVFPDLDKISKEEKDIDDEYYNAEKLLNKTSIGTNIIDGENQSGKSSLLKMLYLRYVESNIYPLLIDATELKKFNYDQTIQNAFVLQYDKSPINFNYFKQFDNEKKVLLIDNFQNLKFNSKTIVTILKELQNRFTNIIIGTSSIYPYLSAIDAEFENINCYSIKTLGFKKRNELIEKYHFLNESPSTVSDQIILEKTRSSFDKVQLVLGNKLMPAYPIYVLSILQSLHYATPYNLEQTSFGYCYQSLLYIALVNKANVKNEDVDSYFNFMSELAYNLYERDSTVISEKELISFYLLYSDNYISRPLEEVKENLLNASILVEDDEKYYKFGYSYIFYFLIAKKIAEIINTESGKKIIDKLCSNLHVEKNANILIFTGHHTKDEYLINEVTLATMLPFEDLLPITLEKDDKFYTLIETIAEDVSSNIIQADRNPRDERVKMLEKQDKNQKIFEKSNDKIEEVEEVTEALRPLFQAFRAIEIVGQIVKNRKGSIPKDRLVSIVSELYNTSFRTITFVGNVYKSTQEDFVESLAEKIQDGDSKHEIIKKIKEFFAHLTFRICLNMFSKLVYSAGNKDLKEVFEEVSKKFDTPAAKLVTFSIKSYYDNISGREVQILAKEFENNPVALSILRARIRNYIYNNNIDYKKKQKFAEALKLRIGGINYNQSSR